MYLGYLTTYRELVRSRNFHETAKRLGLSQSTVSQHIRRLEEFLGVQLIIRKHSGCELTPQALRFNDTADGILSLLDRARESLQRGQVLVGASTNIGTYLLQPELAKCAARLGDDLDFRLQIDRNDRIVEQLLHHQVDIAFTEWWAPQKGFHAELWRKEPLVVILPAKHPLSAQEELDPSSLIHEPMLGGEQATGTGRLLRDQLGDVAEKYSIHMNLGNTMAVIEGVRNGLGISIVQRSAVARESQQTGLALRELKGFPLVKSIYMSHREMIDPEHPVLRLCKAMMEIA